MLRSRYGGRRTLEPTQSATIMTRRFARRRPVSNRENNPMRDSALSEPQPPAIPIAPLQWASSPVLPPRSLKPGASTVVRRRLCHAVGVSPDPGGSLLLHEDYGEPPVAEPSVDIDNAGCQPPPRPVLSRL